MKKNKVFITGAAGFLGSHLAEKLSEMGDEVVGVDNMLGGYADNVPKNIKFHKSFNEFLKSKKNHRIILMTTKASISYTKFKFKKSDTILFGRESAGVPENVHKLIKNRLKIPMENNKRSLNVATSVAIILAESLKQTKYF